MCGLHSCCLDRGLKYWLLGYNWSPLRGSLVYLLLGDDWSPLSGRLVYLLLGYDWCCLLLP